MTKISKGTQIWPAPWQPSADVHRTRDGWLLVRIDTQGNQNV